MKKFLIVVSIIFLLILETNKSYANVSNMQEINLSSENIKTQPIYINTNIKQETFFLYANINNTQKTSNISESNQIINTQKDTLNISDFLRESETYTKEAIPNIKLNDVLTSAITGKIDNVKLIHAFLILFRKGNNKFTYCNNKHNCNYSYTWYFKKYI